MIRIICSSISNIVQDFFSVESVPFSDCKKPNWAKSYFGVDVKAFPFSAPHRYRKLDYKLMRKILSLSTEPLPT
jgi:hypothetical protein